MFVLKKLIGGLLAPVPLVVLLLLAGVVVLWWARRPLGQRWGRRLVTAACVLLVVTAFQPLPALLMEHLERQYDDFVAAEHAGVDVGYVVVLGRGVSDGSNLAPNNQLTSSSLVRLVEGLRVLDHYPEAHLLVSGGALRGQRTEAEAMAATAIQLGIDPARIVEEGASHDTEQQAVNVRALVGDARIVLATSAFHMPRSMALFRAQGGDPIPAPTARFIKEDETASITISYPSAGYLDVSALLMHEYAGRLWAWLRGRV